MKINQQLAEILVALKGLAKFNQDAASFFWSRYIEDLQAVPSVAEQEDFNQLVLDTINFHRVMAQAGAEGTEDTGESASL